MRTPKYEPLDDLTFHAMLAILQTGMWLMNDLEASLRKHGFSQGRLAILLTVLGSEDGKISPKALADEMGKSKPTISRMIDRLAEERYIEVHEDDSDGRRKQITLTSKGTTLLDTVVPPYNKRLDRISEKLSNTDKHTILELLAKLQFEHPYRSVRMPI